MTIEEIFKEAWSLRPGEFPPTKMIGTVKTENDTFYLYGPDKKGEYRYQSESTLKLFRRRKEEDKQREEEKRRRHFI